MELTEKEKRYKQALISLAAAWKNLASQTRHHFRYLVNRQC